MPNLLVQFWHKLDSPGDYCVGCQVTLVVNLDIEDRDVFLGQLTQHCSSFFRICHGPFEGSRGLSPILSRVEVIWSCPGDTRIPYGTTMAPTTSLKNLINGVFRRQLEMVRTRGFVDTLVVRYRISPDREMAPPPSSPIYSSSIPFHGSNNDNNNIINNSAASMNHLEFGGTPSNVSMCGMDGNQAGNAIHSVESRQLDHHHPHNPPPAGFRSLMGDRTNSRFGPPLTAADIRQRMSSTTQLKTNNTTTASGTDISDTVHRKSVSVTEVPQKQSKDNDSNKNKAIATTAAPAASRPLEDALQRSQPTLRPSSRGSKVTRDTILVGNSGGDSSSRRNNNNYNNRRSAAPSPPAVRPWKMIRFKSTSAKVQPGQSEAAHPGPPSSHSVGGGVSRPEFMSFNDCDGLERIPREGCAGAAQ